MSENNLNFMSIFGGEGSLDLGGGETDFESLFTQQGQPAEATQPAAAEDCQATTPDEIPAGNPEPDTPPDAVPEPQTQAPTEADTGTGKNAVSEAEASVVEQTAQPETAAAKPAQAKKSRSGGSGEKAAASDSKDTENPFEAAMKQLETKVAAELAGPLAAKPPVFHFGGVTEDIGDAKQTFEQLREAKMADFPELEDGKRVSWTMEYGKITKTVPKPKESAIHAMKAEIEQSESFLDMLKKSKEKDFICKVRPHIAAQTKGIASYKGIYRTLEEMEQAPKVINLVPARDGHVYEIRCMETGRFVTRVKNANELSDIRAGFYPALPLIPYYLVEQVISFFRHYMQDGIETEAYVRVYWDKAIKEFIIDVPHQQVSKARVFASIPEYAEQDDDLIHYADIHSHNSMPASFSEIDDKDEKATRLYLVVGRLDQYFPEVSARICNGGTFLSIHPGDVLEGVPKDFPSRWCNRVTTDSDAFLITGAEEAAFSLKGAVAA